MNHTSNKKNKEPQKSLLRGAAQQSSLSTNQKNPLFSFQYLDSHYSIQNCEKDDKAALSDQLQLIGSRKWQELQQAPKQGIGYEKIERNSIKAAIPSHLKNDDAVNFLSFRFSGKKPMIGYRADQTFYVIWIDRDFSVYNHG